MISKKQGRFAMKNLLLILFLLPTAFAFHPPHLENANIVDGNSMKGDSGIRGIPYAEQIATMKKLAQDFPQTYEYIEYGKSNRGRPLAGLLTKNSVNDRLALITGAIHGNEYLNIVDRLPNTILNKNFKAWGGRVLFIPIVNPDGYDSRSRRNSRWSDLNRDWPNPANNYRPFKQNESKAMAEYIDELVTEKNLKMDIAVDYHCCVDAMLLLPWGYKRGAYMSSDDQQKSNDVQRLFKGAIVGHGRIGTPPDILYSAVGTTLDYWHDKYGAITFTYEGRHKTESQYLNEHIKWWDDIFGYLSKI